MTEAERLEDMRTRPYRLGVYDKKPTTEEDKAALDKALSALSVNGCLAPLPTKFAVHLAAKPGEVLLISYPPTANCADLDALTKSLTANKIAFVLMPEGFAARTCSEQDMADIAASIAALRQAQ